MKPILVVTLSDLIGWTLCAVFVIVCFAVYLWYAAQDKLAASRRLHRERKCVHEFGNWSEWWTDTHRADGIRQSSRTRRCRKCDQVEEEIER